MSITPKFVGKRPLPPLVRFLDTNGDGTGTSEANGNYVVPTTFFTQPGIEQKFLIDSLFVHYSMSGKLTQNGYGDNAAPLTNGIIIDIILDGTTYQISNGHPVVKNDDWLHLGFTVFVTIFQASADSAQCVIDFPRPVELSGNTDDKIEVILNDNFTFLTDQHFLIHGSYDVGRP